MGLAKAKNPKKSTVGTALKKSLDFQPASLPLRVVTGILLTKEQSFLDRTTAMIVVYAMMIQVMIIQLVLKIVQVLGMDRLI